MDRINRIREMEDRLERVSRWVDLLSAALEQLPSVQRDAYELSSYYESDLWMEDYEADEAGELPADVKRGVLSEDGLYNLLTEYENLVARLQSSEGGKQ